MPACLTETEEKVEKYKVRRTIRISRTKVLPMRDFLGLPVAAVRRLSSSGAILRSSGRIWSFDAYQREVP
jgi:hypothetical protein